MIENVKDCGSIHLFRDIKKEEIEKMFRCSKTVERCFEDGMYIFRQGETPQNLFLVLDGTVMISKDFASGKRDVLFMVGQGDVFGEMFLFADFARLVTLCFLLVSSVLSLMSWLLFVQIAYFLQMLFFPVLPLCFLAVLLLPNPQNGLCLRAAHPIGLKKPAVRR